MNNIVAFRPKKAPIPEVQLPVNTSPSVVTDMIYYISEWAINNGVDIESINYKYEAATIMTVLQGMLHKVSK